MHQNKENFTIILEDRILKCLIIKLDKDSGCLNFVTPYGEELGRFKCHIADFKEYFKMPEDYLDTYDDSFSDYRHKIIRVMDKSMRWEVYNELYYQSCWELNSYLAEKLFDFICNKIIEGDYIIDFRIPLKI